MDYLPVETRIVINDTESYYFCSTGTITEILRFCYGYAIKLDGYDRNIMVSKDHVVTEEMLDTGSF